MAFIQCLFYCHLIGCRCGHWQRGGSPEIGHWKVGLSFEVKAWTALDDERWLNRLNWNRTFFRFMFCFGMYHSTTWYVKLKTSMYRHSSIYAVTVCPIDIGPTFRKFEYINEYRLPSRIWIFEYINKHGSPSRTRLCTQISEYGFWRKSPKFFKCKKMK